MMKDMWSAVAPQSALFSWNIVTHVTMAAVHTTVPIIDLITSVNNNNQSNDVKLIFYLGKSNIFGIYQSTRSAPMSEKIKPKLCCDTDF